MLKKIAYRYRSIPIPAKASIWFVVCNAVQNGCRFLTMPLLVRLLTTEEYGVYSVFLSWISILSIFATLSLHAGVCNNAMLRYPDRRGDYISASQSLSMVVTAMIFVVYLPFSRFIDREVLGLEHSLVFLIFLQLLFTEGFQLWSTRQRYEYRYTSLLIYTAIISVSYMVFTIIAAFLAPADFRLSAVITSGVMVQTLFGCGFIIYNYSKSRCFFDRGFWLYALQFNIPLIPHYLSNVILGQADRVMIKRYIGSSEAGIYSLVYTVSIAVTLITGAVNNAIIPYTYEKMKQCEYKDIGALSKALLLLAGGLVISISVMAPEIIRIIATKEYYSAIWLVPVIALSVYFTFLYSLFCNIEFYFGSNRFIAIASVTAAGTNIVLNYLLLPVFGYFAAGYTTLFCYMLLSLAHYIFMSVICKKRIGEAVYDSRIILFLSLGVVILTFGVMLVYKFIFIRYLIVFLMISICVFKRKQLSAAVNRMTRSNRGNISTQERESEE